MSVDTILTMWNEDDGEKGDKLITFIEVDENSARAIMDQQGVSSDRSRGLLMESRGFINGVAQERGVDATMLLHEENLP